MKAPPRVSSRNAAHDRVFRNAAAVILILHIHEPAAAAQDPEERTTAGPLYNKDAFRGRMVRTVAPGRH